MNSYTINTVRRFYSKKHYLISEVLTSGKELVGNEAVVKGWVKNLRIQKEHVFADISDGSCTKRLQILLQKVKMPESLSFGCSVQATGQIKTSPRGSIELIAENIDVLGDCVLDESYPYRPRKSYSSEFSRQFLHLRPRTNKNSALLRVRNRVTMALHNFFQEHCFMNVPTPILTSNDCEGAGELFKVIPDNIETLKEMKKEGMTDETAYFNTKTYLTCSGQLHLEALCRSLGNVYTFGPTFRAENSKSRLHLSEFYMVEAEIAFNDNIEQLLKITEDLLKYVLQKVLDENEDDLFILYDKQIPEFHWLYNQFTILRHKEAVNICNHATSLSSKASLDESLNKEQELFLVKHCDGPVFIVEWPKHLKSFYMKGSNNENMVGFIDSSSLFCEIYVKALVA